MRSLVLAYIDPSAGSQLLQVLAAGLFSMAFVLKLSWNSLRNFLHRGVPHRGQGTPTDADLSH